MTRPSDRFVAEAFWEICHDESWIGKVGGRKREDIARAAAFSLRVAIVTRAEELEAEAGGAVRQIDMHTSAEKVSTSPEHVYIPPDGKVACPIPTCRAEMLPGKTCGGAECGLRGK